MSETAARCILAGIFTGLIAGWLLKSLHTFVLDRIARKRRHLRQIIDHREPRPRRRSEHPRPAIPAVAEES